MTRVKKDKYDLAIAYLSKHPRAIMRAWDSPYVHRAGCLFKFVLDGCACLTQIRSGANLASERLTLKIRGDKRIPFSHDIITVGDLPVFAEWHRKLDKLGADGDLD